MERFKAKLRVEGNKPKYKENIILAVLCTLNILLFTLTIIANTGDITWAGQYAILIRTISVAVALIFTLITIRILRKMENSESYIKYGTVTIDKEEDNLTFKSQNKEIFECALSEFLSKGCKKIKCFEHNNEFCTYMVANNDILTEVNGDIEKLDITIECKEREFVDFVENYESYI